MSGGVYAIVNTVNGHVYIGATSSFVLRWRAHQKALNEGTHHNKHLQAAWRRYGSQAFVFRKLAVILKETERYRVELDWIRLACRLLGFKGVYNRAGVDDATRPKRVRAVKPSTPPTARARSRTRPARKT